MLLSLVTFSALAQHPVSLTLKPPSSQNEQFLSTWTLTVTNQTNRAIENVHVSISSPPSPIVEVPAICTARDSNADCNLPLAALSSRDIVFTIRNARETGHYGVVAHAFGLSAVMFDEAIFGRDYVVATTADSGAGSLRQAIVDMNRDCVTNESCKTSFAIDGTIVLHSPLPEITGNDVSIDGGSRIHLDGSAAGLGHGLMFRNSLARATGLTITGFDGNAIETHAAFSMILRNDLRANRSRGVVFVGGRGYVVDNQLTGNGRSGGFFWTSNDVRVQRNVVANNGASGLFFHKPEFSFQFSEAVDNVITGNAHAGIGLSLTTTGDYARNTFADNGAGPLDIGLDGPSRSTVTGAPGLGGVVGAPVITSARFANGVTTVTGRLAPPAGAVNSFQRLTLFAGSGDVTEAIVTQSINGSEFTITIDRDLRGQLVRGMTYTNVIYNFDHSTTGTSEMGEPRLVE